jgi:hypothetical protein
MPELSRAPLPDATPTTGRADRIALFLRAHAVHLDMISNYEELLQATIFIRETAGCDAKLLKKYRRALQSADSYKVLTIIWKESRFVPLDRLVEAGLCRNYEEGDLTAHRLAADLTESPHDVAKLNSRIRNIGLAAAAYQLVDRDLVCSTKVIFKGTHLLHEFMSDLSAKNILAMSGLVPLSKSIFSPNSDGER